MLRFCVASGWREDNPAAQWDRSAVKERRDPFVLMPREHIEAMVEAAPGNFAHLIRFAEATGMREEEIASLEWSQIRGRTIDLTRTKTNRARAVPLNDRALSILGDLPRHLRCPYVFWHEARDENEEPTRYHNVSSRFGAIRARVNRDRAKQNEDLREGEKLSLISFRFHDLRHLFAIDFLREGRGSIYQLQKILGHTSVKTTEGYLDHLTPDEAEAAKSSFGHPAHNPAQTAETR